MTLRLDTLDACFHGIVPGVVATCSADGTPNVSYVSHVQHVDSRRVALSCQFFNKTRQNLDENPFACVQLHDPVTFEAFQLHVRFEHSETDGPLFEAMSLRIQAIASHTGMLGVFRLRSADVCEVLSAERVDGFLEPPAEAAAPVESRGAAATTELGGLQLVSERVHRACDLKDLLESTLVALDEAFDFSHGRSSPRGAS